jgi:hypothetical protein
MRIWEERGDRFERTRRWMELRMVERRGLGRWVF